MSPKSHLMIRNGYYYFNRRVPIKLRKFDPRIVIRISLETDSRDIAIKRAHALNEEIENYWRELIKIGETHSDKKFQQAIHFARLLGFTYMSSAQIAQRSTSISDVYSRLIVAEETKLESEPHIEAVLGGVSPPELTITEALERFWSFTKDRIMNKSDNQIRKWENPRKKAINNFVEVVGNKKLTELTRQDIIQFRDWWIGRIEKDGLNESSANKDIIHLKNVIETVCEHNRLPVDASHLFKKIVLRERFVQARVPFSKKEILSILNYHDLTKLNDEARWFLYIAAETGARPSEIVGLLPEDIFIKTKIPYIKIVDRPDRPLKTPHSAREIPLVGYALDAFNAMPKGFPRYRDKPDSLSTLLNKFLREGKLLPSDKHSVYSMRHSFQDRILRVNAPDRVQAELMGHKFERPVYGDGPTLKQKHQWLKKIQLKK